MSPQVRSQIFRKAFLQLVKNVDRVLDLATSHNIISALENKTIEAKNLGFFGSPSLVVSGEVFWGDDRLEDALTWATKGSLSPV